MNISSEYNTDRYKNSAVVDVYAHQKKNKLMIEWWFGLEQCDVGGK